MRLDLHRIAARVAAYDFKTKMKINMLAIEEISRAVGTDDHDAVAAHIMESPVHGAIQALADAIHDEAAKVSKDIGLRAG
jgi:hypothetical protein